MKRQLALFIGFLMLFTGCTATQPDVEKWIKGEDEAWSTHDVEKILSFYTEDCIYEDVADGKIVHGKDEFRVFITGFFKAVPNIKIKTTSFFVSGNHACLEGVMSGTPKGGTEGFPLPNDKSFSVRVAHICELREGKVAKATDYYDGASLMKQLGLLPSPQEP